MSVRGCVQTPRDLRDQVRRVQAEGRRLVTGVLRSQGHHLQTQAPSHRLQTLVECKFTYSAIYNTM